MMRRRAALDQRRHTLAWRHAEAISNDGLREIIARAAVASGRTFALARAS
jgi:hypothetical protein